MTKLSKEHRKKISEAMKIAHKENRHPGWQNANRNNKSYPERLFAKMLKDNGFYDKYEIIEQFLFHGYFFDFALIDLKCDIEVDGIQHFRTDEAIDYDKNRDNFTLNKGWIVYRISAKELLLNPKHEFKMFCEFIESNNKFRKYDVTKVLEKFKAGNKYGNREDYFREIKKNNVLQNQPLVEKLMNSDIEFDKFGWVSKAANIIGISPQKVSGWMKRNAPEFYKEKCFKRK